MEGTLREPTGTLVGSFVLRATQTSSVQFRIALLADSGQRARHPYQGQPQERSAGLQAGGRSTVRAQHSTQWGRKTTDRGGGSQQGGNGGCSEDNSMS
uniref:Uncharacterized protein n=1 Tax=Knipowitschia caucasica TaxID=637954 RepID=A0AAV2M3E0_KNICA